MPDTLTRSKLVNCRAAERWSRPISSRLWDRVELHLGENGTVECAVRWLKGGRIGLEFAHETGSIARPTSRQPCFATSSPAPFPIVEFEGAGEVVQPARPRPASSAPTAAHPLIWSGTIHHDFQQPGAAAQHFRDRRDGRVQRDASGRLRAFARGWRRASRSNQRRVGRRGSGGPQVPAAVRPYPARRAKPEVAPARWRRQSYLKAGTTATRPGPANGAASRCPSSGRPRGLPEALT